MRLTAYPTVPTPAPMRPASSRRPWMDDTEERFAYRCLPLTIANQHGWEILSPCSFEALWNGGVGMNAITIVPLDGPAALSPDSHFGQGVLTFHTGYLFRTEAPYALYVTGPPNGRKDGLVPLSGLVETCWSPFTFTMNWIFTRAGALVRFEKGEPFCHVFPVDPALAEAVEPEIRDLASNPELETAFREWSASRYGFNKQLLVPQSSERVQGWQRFYTRGALADSTPADAKHRTRIVVKSFADRRPPAEDPSSPAIGTARRASEPGDDPHRHSSGELGCPHAHTEDPGTHPQPRTFQMSPDVVVQHVDAQNVVLFHQRTLRRIQMNRPLYERMRAFSMPTRPEQVLPKEPDRRATALAHLEQLCEWEFLVPAGGGPAAAAAPARTARAPQRSRRRRRLKDPK